MKILLALSVFAIFVLQTHTAVSQSTSSSSIGVINVAWSPDGARIAGSSEDARVFVWDANDLSDHLLVFQIETADEIMWTPDSEYLIAQGTTVEEENHLKMSATKWDASTGELVETLMYFEMDTTFEFNPYGYYIFPALAFDQTTTQSAFSYRDGAVLISDGSQVLHLENPSPTSHVYLMRWSQNSERIAIVYGTTDTYSIQVFDTESGEIIHIISQDQQYFVTDLAWDATGSYLATSSMRYTCCEGWSNIGIYHIEQDEVLRFSADRWWDEVASNPAPIVWHPRDLIIAVATQEAIEIYDPFTENALLSISAEGVRDLAWSPDGTRIVGALPDGTIQIWEVTF